MAQKGLFLDRDGIVNIDKSYLYKAEDFIFIDSIFDICKHFLARDYLIFIITNQSGIARGYYSEDDLSRLHSWMLKEFESRGVTITDINYCPHHHKEGIGRYKIDCDCRKPKSGMIDKLVERYDIDRSNSILIGDKLSDIKAGKNGGIATNILIKSQYQDRYDYESLEELADSLNAK
ncbi:D-glycero-D-manno-heptose 1,7-bisphosphate phosphatase [hydrothermal vent metagenome]|uniref:D,D-heptose 1,7-bisphosphate phosphatase n=1 Tax=hydrothermal vent metagenome TaxID=652676 RepID=A0A1W1BT11_9ZZZZ